jgi:apolipoprotein N-acyltransferase
MVKKKNSTWQPWLLFLISASLFAAGWLMKSFPIFIFFAFAPLFAVADQAKENDEFWVNTEFILLALFTAFFASSSFNSSHLIAAIIQAIVFTVAFLAYSFAYSSLGSRLGKFTIIFFWLGLEYILLKLPWRNESIFMADAVALKTSWLHWTTYTGYLGASLWILCTGLLLYMALFKNSINLTLLGLTVALLIAPIAFSYFISESGIDRNDMISLYTQNSSVASRYSKQGELVPRTAAWISVAILLLAFVKTQTRKK